MATSVATKSMAFYCFEALETYLLNHGRLDTLRQPDFPNDDHCLFVTWTKGPNERLRGCIGTFQPQKLHYGLKNYAIESATNDSRFQPVEAQELPDLHVGVSILTNFEPAKNCLDWEIGKHGIKIEYQTTTGHKISGTFLPQVAEEAGWTKEETLRNLFQKGRFYEPITDEVKRNTKLTRYQSEKVHCSYPEYATWKSTR